VNIKKLENISLKKKTDKREEEGKGKRKKGKGPCTSKTCMFQTSRLVEVGLLSGY